MYFDRQRVKKQALVRDMCLIQSLVELACAQEIRTGIQQIEYNDSYGNTIKRWYDFDKGAFASNPSGESPTNSRTQNTSPTTTEALLKEGEKILSRELEHFNGLDNKEKMDYLINKASAEQKMAKYVGLDSATVKGAIISYKAADKLLNGDMEGAIEAGKEHAQIIAEQLEEGGLTLELTDKERALFAKKISQLDRFWEMDTEDKLSAIKQICNDLDLQDSQIESIVDSFSTVQKSIEGVSQLIEVATRYSPELKKYLKPVLEAYKDDPEKQRQVLESVNQTLLQQNKGLMLLEAGLISAVINGKKGLARHNEEMEKMRNLSKNYSDINPIEDKLGVAVAGATDFVVEATAFEEVIQKASFKKRGFNPFFEIRLESTGFNPWRTQEKIIAMTCKDVALEKIGGKEPSAGEITEILLNYADQELFGG